MYPVWELSLCKKWHLYTHLIFPFTASIEYFSVTASVKVSSYLRSPIILLLSLAFAPITKTRASIFLLEPIFWVIDHSQSLLVNQSPCLPWNMALKERGQLRVAGCWMEEESQELLPVCSLLLMTVGFWSHAQVMVIFMISGKILVSEAFICKGYCYNFPFHKCTVYQFSLKKKYTFIEFYPDIFILLFQLIKIILHCNCSVLFTLIWFLSGYNII